MNARPIRRRLRDVIRRVISRSDVRLPSRTKKKKKQPPGLSPCQRERHTCDMSPWISPVCFVTRRPAPIMQMQDGCCCSLRSRGSMREHIMLLHAGLSNTPVHETQSAGGPESSRLVRVLRGSLSLSLSAACKQSSADGGTSGVSSSHGRGGCKQADLNEKGGE